MRVMRAAVKNGHDHDVLSPSGRWRRRHLPGEHPVAGLTQRVIVSIAIERKILQRLGIVDTVSKNIRAHQTARPFRIKTDNFVTVAFAFPKLRGEYIGGKGFRTDGLEVF